MALKCNVQCCLCLINHSTCQVVYHRSRVKVQYAIWAKLFSTQPLNLSSLRKFAQLTVGMILSIHLTKEGRIGAAVCLRADMKGPVYSTHKSRRGIIWAARRGAARGCGRCGGSRVHAGSDLTLDSRAHVYAYTTPAAARRHRHRCLPALNTLNILHAHQLTERRRYPSTHRITEELPEPPSTYIYCKTNVDTFSRGFARLRQKEGTVLVKRKLADCQVLSVNFQFQLVTLIYQNQII